MKYFEIIPLTLFACVVITSGNNYTWGTIKPDDVLLDRNVIKKEYETNKVVLGYYSFQSNKGGKIYLITGIRLIDQYTNGMGGYANLDNAGPGFTSVSISLKSQRSAGFRFIIEIYGRSVS